MKQFTKLHKLSRGDQVAIISPSADLAGRFPWVEDLGLERLVNIFGLQPKEYPTTRGLNNSLKDRARDIMLAFEDPENKAVIASIGGQDQIKLLRYLDPEILKQNPKPFFGFSDNTHLSNYLWNLGIPSYYGACIMTQFAMQDSMHDFTIEYLKHALFDSGEFELLRSQKYNDVTSDWADKTSLSKPRLMETNEQWYWDGTQDVEGTLWGGCLESMVVQLSSAIYIPKDEELDNTILFLESADGNTDAWVAEYVLTGFGERGWLDKFKAVLVGRPKAWELDLHRDADEKAQYRKSQRELITKTIRDYNKDIPIIQNLDFGHTDPQAVIPNGQIARVVSSEKRIFLNY